VHVGSERESGRENLFLEYFIRAMSHVTHMKESHDESHCIYNVDVVCVCRERERERERELVP